MEEFLKEYDASKYERPSLTVDVLIFAKSDNNKLKVLLVRRTEEPFKDCLALPGGFIRVEEELEQTVERVLKGKVGVSNLNVEQLYTFGGVGRDPRTRVVSVAYFCLLPSTDLIKNDKLLWCDVKTLINSDYNFPVAFDHLYIINKGVERIRGKVDYTNIAFDLLHDKKKFTIHELQMCFETILDKELDKPNFRRMFNTRFIKNGIVKKTGEKCKDFARESDYYKLKEEE